MGVYAREAAVPPRRRLPAIAGRYADRDLFAEYESMAGFTEWQSKKHARCRRAWEAHMETRGGDPAFPSVADVDSFLSERIDAVAMDTVYRIYWTYLRRFFKWALWRTDCPHRYNPVLMACVETEAGQEMWTYFIETVKGELLDAKEAGELE